VSATIEGSGTAGSGPKTATELENTTRDTLPPAFTCARSASSSARVLSMFERRPRSKSASHSPDTADARWNTPSNDSSRSASVCASSGPVRAETRVSVSRSSGGGAMSVSTIERMSRPFSCPRLSSVRASRAPRKPPPPVMSSFMRMFP
jgi:hypothetical protein